jgi:mono/diheme cytochrome c family protein
MRKLPFAPAMVAVAVVTAGGYAWADTSRGGMLAAQLCAGCHAIMPGQSSPKTDAPPFAIVAAKSGTNIFTLRPALRTPHWTSTNLTLRPDDIDALASYIMSLRPGR